MSILKSIADLLKIGFMSDSAMKKFIHESGICPERDYQKKIAQNTKKVQIENERFSQELKALKKALEELSQVFK